MFSNEGTKILEGETLVVWKLRQTLAKLIAKKCATLDEIDELRGDIDLIIQMSPNPTIVRHAQDMMSDLCSCLPRMERYA